MRIWTVANSKGGATKSTVAINLACCAAQHGEKVVILDADYSQQSAKNWWDDSEIENPVVVPTQLNEIAEKVERAKKAGVSHVVIDTPGKMTFEVIPAMEMADMCIIPVQPAPTDTRALNKFMSAVVNADVNFVFVCSRCPPTGNDYEWLKNAISTYGSLAPTSITERKGMKESSGAGLDIGSYAKTITVKRDRIRVEKGAQEILEIYEWILKKEKRLAYAF